MRHFFFFFFLFFFFLLLFSSSSPPSLACGPCRLTSASFGMIAHADLSSASSISWHPSTSDLSHDSLTTLILVFLLFFFVWFPQKYFPYCPTIRHSYRMTNPFSSLTFIVVAIFGFLNATCNLSLARTFQLLDLLLGHISCSVSYLSTNLLTYLTIYLLTLNKSTSYTQKNSKKQNDGKSVTYEVGPSLEWPIPCWKC
jgi:hypothetical protein